MKSILFVCLGNICRSPLADGIANKIAREGEKDLYIDSAGTSNWHKGEAPCQHSIDIASLHKIDISGLKSRPIIKKDIQEFKYIVAMDEQNKKDLISYGFKDVFKIGDFGGLGGADIPDPYHFRELEGFQIVFEMIEKGVVDFLTQVENGKLDKKA